MAGYVVDAHALIWFLGQNPRLGSLAKEAIAASDSILYLPAVALAEVLWIVKSRQLGLTADDIVAALEQDSRVVIVPLSKEIVLTGHFLPGGLEMHDRQIVATAIRLGENNPLPVISVDREIVESGLVPIIW